MTMFNFEHLVPVYNEKKENIVKLIDFSVRRQKGLTMSHLHTELDPLAFTLVNCLHCFISDFKGSTSQQQCRNESNMGMGTL